MNNPELARENAVKLIKEINKALRIKPITYLQGVIARDIIETHSGYLRIKIHKINTLGRIYTYMFNKYFDLYDITLRIKTPSDHSWIDLYKNDSTCFVTYHT